MKALPESLIRVRACFAKFTVLGMAELCAYLLVSWLNNRGQCQCGWTGRRRLLRGSAVVDVLTHCAHTGHVPHRGAHVRPVPLPLSDGAPVARRETVE